MLVKGEKDMSSVDCGPVETLTDAGTIPTAPASARDAARWPAGRAIAFLVASSGLLWGAIIVAIDLIG